MPKQQEQPQIVRTFLPVEVNDDMRAAASKLVEKYMQIEEVKNYNFPDTTKKVEEAFQNSVKALKEATYAHNPNHTPKHLKALNATPIEKLYVEKNITTAMNQLIDEAAANAKYTDKPIRPFARGLIR